jgi:hypothetical protein
MADDPKDETYSEEETVKRREATLQRMLNTPHKPHKKLRTHTTVDKRGRHDSNEPDDPPVR